MFGQRQVVVTLERDGLLVDNLRWVYPPGTVLNQEVIDAKQFLKVWSDYWQSLGLKKSSVLIVISDQLLYSKTADRELAEFWNEVPLNNTNTARKVVYEPNKVTMMATNRELYSLVAQGIENAKGEVKAVVPVNYAADKEAVKRTNFLNEASSTNSTHKPNHWWVWVLVGGVWVGVIILVLLKISGRI